MRILWPVWVESPVGSQVRPVLLQEASQVATHRKPGTGSMPFIHHLYVEVAPPELAGFSHLWRAKYHNAALSSEVEVRGFQHSFSIVFACRDSSIAVCC